MNKQELNEAKEFIDNVIYKINDEPQLITNGDRNRGWDLYMKLYFEIESNYDTDLIDFAEDLKDVIDEKLSKEPDESKIPNYKDDKWIGVSAITEGDIVLRMVKHQCLSRPTYMVGIVSDIKDEAYDFIFFDLLTGEPKHNERICFQEFDRIMDRQNKGLDTDYKFFKVTNQNKELVFCLSDSEIEREARDFFDTEFISKMTFDQPFPMDKKDRVIRMMLEFYKHLQNKNNQNTNSK